jgi:heat-inducible transcriptional repressor
VPGDFCFTGFDSKGLILTAFDLIFDPHASDRTMKPRESANDALNARQQQVLTAIVDHFIVTAEPVSSKVLSLNPVFHASSATLRNTMAELTDLGYVEQLHSSAGRRPTDQGYRTYVDELMQPLPLPEADIRTLETGLSGISDDQELMNQAALVLGRMTQLVGVAVTPSVNEGMFRHISLLPLEAGRVLVVLHGSGMLIRSTLADETLNTSFFRLESLANRLNAEMQGRPMADLGPFLQKATEVSGSQEEVRALSFLKRSIMKLIDSERQQELQVSGTHHFMKSRFFDKIEDLESLLEIVESKFALVHFLRNQADQNGVHVTIGQEQRDGKPFRSLSIVTEAFRYGESTGIVGVMGPKRLPYNYLVSLVHHAAKTLNRGPHSASHKANDL